MDLKPSYFMHCLLSYMNVFIFDIGDQNTTFVCASKGH